MEEGEGAAEDGGRERAAGDRVDNRDSGRGTGEGRETDGSKRGTEEEEQEPPERQQRGEDEDGRPKRKRARGVSKEGPYQDRPPLCPFRLLPLLIYSGSVIAFLKFQRVQSPKI